MQKKAHMLALQEQEIFYPESDGKPMAETDVHRNLLLKMAQLLQSAFPKSYVSGNICLYYEQGNPRKMISPDGLLCRSQSKGEKRVYLAWEANAQLDLVLEYSSFSTKREGHHKKKRIYQDILKVPYYVIFDPHAVYLSVFELQKGQYRLLETDEKGHVLLPNLGIQVAIENANSLRLFDKEENLILSDAEKNLQRFQEEKLRADQTTEWANQETKRADQETKRADQEVKRADQEASRAEQALSELRAEHQRLEDALAEKERLKALLKSAGISTNSSV